MKITQLQINKGQIEGLPANPRFIKDDKYKKLVKSIKENPEMLELRELLVYPYGGKYVIIGGNMRYRACKELGYTDIPVKIIPETATVEQLRAYTIKDNNGFGDWDFDMLSDELDLSELEDWGLDIPDFETEEKTEIVEDEPPEVYKESDPTTKLGDVWQLGRHRLMCGNSFSQFDIDKLLNGAKCELTFTDPPYNFKIHSVGGIYKKKQSIKQIKKNRVNIFDPSMLILQSETNIYFHNKQLIKKYIELAEINNKSYDLCFYKKLFPIPNYKGHMMTDCEYIAIIGKQDPNKGLPYETYSKCYIGTKDKDNKLSYSKPIELCKKYILLYGKENILDLFGGSGSTLIACEQLNRTCYMMELDPHYCDVIVKRWETLTGEKAVKIE